VSAAAAAAAVREVPLVGHPLAICVSSDGIWDNWRFEDVASFLNTPARVDRAVQSGKAEQACTELMAENLTRARNNFGSSADNMSCIVLYLVPRGGEASPGPWPL
jgi:serine/threonine protein phosphatase PrpC